MARFYFHLKDGDRVIKDSEGSNLADTEQARNEGLIAARELVAAAIRAGKQPSVEALIVADGKGAEIMVVRLAEVIPTRLRAH
jgi:hypothetical protein